MTTRFDKNSVVVISLEIDKNGGQFLPVWGRMALLSRHPPLSSWQMRQSYRHPSSLPVQWLVTLVDWLDWDWMGRHFGRTRNCYYENLLWFFITELILARDSLPPHTPSLSMMIIRGYCKGNKFLCSVGSSLSVGGIIFGARVLLSLRRRCFLLWTKLRCWCYYYCYHSLSLTAICRWMVNGEKEWERERKIGHWFMRQWNVNFVNLTVFLILFLN